MPQGDLECKGQIQYFIRYGLGFDAEVDRLSVPEHLETVLHF